MREDGLRDKGLRIRGFTFVELMVSIAIFAVAIAIIYAIFISGRRAQTGQEELAMLAQEARGGLEQMEMELRMAGVVTAGLANKPCKLEDSLNKVIFIEALSNAIEFEGDVDVNGILDRVRYEYNPTTKILYRMTFPAGSGVTSRNDSDPTGIACGTSIKNKAGITQEPVAFFINSLSFSYFDSDGAAMTGPYTTSNQDETENINKIKVFVQAKGVQTAGGQPNYRTASMEINLGNIGTTLGVKRNPPQPPTNFDAWDPNVCGIIQMSWTKAEGADIAGYKLYYKSTDLTDWITANISSSRTSWQLAGMDTTKTWELKLASFDIYGNISNTTSVETVGPLVDNILPPAPAISPVVTNSASGSATVSWSGSDKDKFNRTTDINGQSYPVDFILSYTNTQTAVTNTVQIYNGTSYTVTGLDRCINYNFKVKAVDACGNTGPDSSTVTAMVSTNENPPQPYFNPSVGGYTGASRGKAKYYRLNVTGTNANAVAFLDTKFVYRSGSGSCTPLTGRPEDLNPSVGKMDTMVWSPSPATVGAGGSFSGHWDDAIDAYYCLSAYTEDLCGRKSDLLFRYEVRGACNDASSPFNGSGGLGDCVGDISVRVCDADSFGTDPCKTDPLTYCDGVTLFWPKKYNDTGCTAYPGLSNGEFLNMESDFFPDIGVGGYILSRATESSAYNDLAPDPVTGPDTPYFFADANKYEVSCSNQGIRDGCTYRYKVRPIDCAVNSGTAREALKPVGVGTVAYLKPGRFAYDVGTTYPTKVLGRSLNIVQFYVKNTAAANMTLTRAVFDWDEENWGGKVGRIKEVQMNVSGNWVTIWPTAGQSPVARNTEIDVTDTQVQASSGFGVIPEDIKRAGFRLAFVDTAGKPLRMTSNNLGVNPRITATLYYKNESSSTTFSSLQTECKPRGGFVFTVPGGPAIDGVQGPTTTAMLNSPAPPAGQMREDLYLVESTSGVTVTASVHPFLSGSTYVSVPQCGATVWYRTTDFNTTSPALPTDANGENVLAPTNYTGINMCNTSGTSCTSATCTYRATIPAQPGTRIWYYITASDDAGNFGMAPVQGETFSSYTYDQKRKYYYLWISGDYDSNPFLADGAPNPDYQKVKFLNFWATGYSACTTDWTFPDTTSVGSASNFTITEYDASNNIVKSESLGPFTTLAPGAGCSGCYACESGLPYAFSTTASQFPEANRVVLSLTETKADFTTKTCTWTKPPGAITFSSSDTECKGSLW